MRVPGSDEITKALVTLPLLELVKPREELHYLVASHSELVSATEILTNSMIRYVQEGPESETLARFLGGIAAAFAAGMMLGMEIERA